MAFAAARRDGGQDGPWPRYTAVDHAGSVEVGLGDEAGSRGERNGGKGRCHLLPIVATGVGKACDVYREMGLCGRS
jgi:hypothetical protein